MRIPKLKKILLPVGAATLFLMLIISSCNHSKEAKAKDLQIDSLSTHVGYLGERVSSLSSDSARMHNDNKRLRAQVEGYAADLAIVDDENRKLKSQLSGLASSKRSLAEKLALLETTVGELKNAATQKDGLIAEFKSKLAHAINRANSAEDEAKKHRDKTSKLAAKSQELDAIKKLIAPNLDLLFTATWEESHSNAHRLVAPYTPSVPISVAEKIYSKNEYSQLRKTARELGLGYEALYSFCISNKISFSEATPRSIKNEINRILTLHFVEWCNLFNISQDTAERIAGLAKMRFS